jgi:methyl-accepting chemotaxis protein
MFPKSFRATVRQRLVIWGSLLGILGALFAAAELISTARLSDYSTRLINQTAVADEMSATIVVFSRISAAIMSEAQSPDPADIAEAARATSAFVARIDGEAHNLLVDVVSALNDASRLMATDRPAARLVMQAITAQRIKARAALNASTSNIVGGLAYHVANSRQNKILLSLLGLFMVALIVSLEYRWLVRPIIGMAGALGAGDPDQRWLGKLAMRRDEIGMLGRALTAHLREQRAVQDAAATRLSTLSGEIARQELLQAQSQLFQERIAMIAAAIDQHAARMSGASGELARLSSFVDERASAAAQSTQRASSHVDDVAGAIADVSRLLTNTAGEARATSEVADGAKSLVAAAAIDNDALAQAVVSIDQVIDIIASVASKTNLLALNATIEAAHAGEAGRGFAVVASEVKQLASRTAEATNEVRHGLSAVRTAAAGLSQRVGALVVSVDQVDGAAATISDLAQRQETSSRAISSSTAKTAGDVRLAAEQVGQLAGMVEDWRRTGESVTLASADLERQAAELRNAVDGFIAQTREIAQTQETAQTREAAA